MPSRIPKSFLLELVTKPGIKNFIFLLFLWYVGIAAYTALGPSPWSFGYRIKYYTQWSWLNFVLVYVLVVWVIPYALKQEKLTAHIAAILASLAAFIMARYLYNTLIDPDYYTIYTQKRERHPESWTEIIQDEGILGTELIILGYAFRLLIERVIQERNRRELEKAKLKSELAALRYQLSPHFLFNAFNSIYAMALRKSDNTPDALLKLSDMFRYMLHHHDEMVVIGQEIDHVKRMIDFEHIRFPNSVILTQWEIQPGAEYVMVLPLILSTFVENAFKHGDPGTEEQPLGIKLSLSKNKLEYLVVNPIMQSNPERMHKKGLGLDNLSKRLQLTYPDKHIIETRERDGLFVAKLEINLHP